MAYLRLMMDGVVMFKLAMIGRSSADCSKVKLPGHFLLNWLIFNKIILYADAIGVREVPLTDICSDSPMRFY
jgi:hypothetical protein